jgi:hypothetical protein
LTGQLEGKKKDPVDEKKFNFLSLNATYQEILTQLQHCRVAIRQLSESFAKESNSFGQLLLELVFLRGQQNGGNEKSGKITKFRFSLTH